MNYRILVVAALIWPFAAHSAEAQVLRGRNRIAGHAQTPARQQLEQRLRTGMTRVVKQRVGLSDEQMSRLAQANAQFGARRKQLNRDERLQRQELRAQLMAGSNANQDRIASALDRMLALQRDRIDLQIEEQRQLATFMTPMQRARYAALQEQVRRRLQGARAAGATTPADSE